jgi:hypothetical protein
VFICLIHFKPNPKRTKIHINIDLSDFFSTFARFFSKYCRWVSSTHNDYVGIVGNHFNGVSEGFSFGGTGCGRIGKTDYASSEPVDGSFETETGAGGWFKKQSRGYFALQNVLIGI